MRPHKIINCVLWLVIGIITLHVLIFFIIPLITSKNVDMDYSSIRRDVKELRVNENFQTDCLLNKLHYQVFERIPIKSGLSISEMKPIPLTVKKRENFNLNEFMKEFNESLYGKPVDSLNSTQLLRILHQINHAQHISNSHYLDNIEFVIVIQVHNRLEYLTILIDSLLNVKDIHRTLLIFSHDIYLPDINFLIRSIRFAPTLQIFFPFNQQVFTQEFPGFSSKDCDFNKNKNSGEVSNCFNKRWSDSYGHYRHYKFTQTKHHWTWKANFVFERVEALKSKTLPTVFIEEDHYLTEDFIHVLRLMWEEKNKNYPKVSIVSLGTYEKPLNFNPSARMQYGSWISSFHNMGMTFDRSLWNKLKECAKSFCEFDDYNWDWSLHFVSKKCLKEDLQVLLLKFAPRIYHIGECGIHHKKKECNPYIIIYKIRKILLENRLYLYPDKMIQYGTTNTRSKPMKPNGGWGDKRDQKLCLKLFLESDQLDIVDYVSYLPINSSSSSSSVYYQHSNWVYNNKTTIFFDNQHYSLSQLSILEYVLLK